MSSEEDRDIAYADLLLDHPLSADRLAEIEAIAAEHDDSALLQALLERRLEQGAGDDEVRVAERLADVLLARGSADRAASALRRAAYVAERDADADAEERLMLRLARLDPRNRRATERFRALAEARGAHGEVAAFWAERLAQATDPGERAEALDMFEHVARRSPVGSVDLAPLARALDAAKTVGFAARVRGAERRIRATIAPPHLRGHDGSIAFPTCPSCGRTAPAIVEGDRVRCSACRAPLAPSAAGLAAIGDTAKRVGGTVARVFGWLTLAFGLLMSVAIALPLHLWRHSLTLDAIAVALVSLVTVPLALSLLRGGGFLARRGTESERARRVDILKDLAAHHGGAIGAELGGKVLGVSTAEADALLTDLATRAQGVEVDLTEQGEVLYRFGAAALRDRVRVEKTNLAGGAQVGEPLDEEIAEAAAHQETK